MITNNGTRMRECIQRIFLFTDGLKLINNMIGVGGSVSFSIAIEHIAEGVDE